jgi:hypothetical protein
MADIRAWLDSGTISAERMPALLPVLIRQARLERPITYGAVARELGVHHRAIRHIAGHIGHTLAAIGEHRGWKRRQPPPLHALVVNDITGLPGPGINGFLSATYRRASSDEAKRNVLKAIYAEAGAYPHWPELCALLDVPFNEGALGAAVEKARKSRGRGGEGPDHLRLKMHVAAHPEIVGLAAGSADGEVEWGTASGDCIDIVFERRGRQLAVEVKPHHASEGDMIRGVFQCLKYREVLKAEAVVADLGIKVRVLLVLGGKATPDVIRISHRLGIKVLEGVQDH